MEKLNITLVGQGPDVSERLKAMSYAPFALRAYLDCHLKPEIKDKVEVKVIDFDWDILVGDMASQILKDCPQVVGFSVYLWNYHQILECARTLKAAKEDIIIILGGPQVSPVAKDVLLENSSVDIIPFACAAGEIILADIVEAIFHEKDLSVVNGIAMRNSKGDIIQTSSDVRPFDYSSAPSPYGRDKDFFAEGRQHMAIIESSRGCYSDCGYCAWTHGKQRIESFPMKRILKDIEVLYNNPRIKYVFFTESNFLFDIKRAENILEHVTKQKSRAKSNFEITYNFLTENTTKLMASFYDFWFVLAVQSTNPKALACIGKMRPRPQELLNKRKQVKEWVPKAKHQIDIMLGLPGDDLKGFLETLDFALSLEAHYIVLAYPVYLLPGSRFFKNRDSLGLKYTRTVPYSVIETDTFPQSDIEEALRIAIWLQILTFYYPAIARFFYSLARRDNLRIERLMKWVSAIEKKVNLFAGCNNLSDVATSSVVEWNKLKKKLLEKASRAESALEIYSAVRAAEVPCKTIDLGCKVCRYTVENNLDAIEFDSYELLPPSIKEENDSQTVKELFSIYRR